jgi:hypothetical protein
VGVCDLRTTLIFLEAPSGLLAAGFWFYASWISWGLFRAPKVGDFNKNTRQNYIYNAIAHCLLASPRCFNGLSSTCRRAGDFS